MHFFDVLSFTVVHLNVNAVLLQLHEMLVSYSNMFKDPFVLTPPAWYKSFVICELVLQFPFFFAASYAFWKGCSEHVYTHLNGF